ATARMSRSGSDEPVATARVSRSGSDEPVATASANTRSRFARLPVLSAAAPMAVLLTAFSNRYGYHRDELYFRMLRPAWGYVDQPPLAPMLVRSFSQLSDSAWAIRLPATLAAAGSVLVVALIAREVGGGRAAQALA